MMTESQLQQKKKPQLIPTKTTAWDRDKRRAVQIEIKSMSIKPSSANGGKPLIHNCRCRNLHTHANLIALLHMSALVAEPTPYTPAYSWLLSPHRSRELSLNSVNYWTDTKQSRSIVETSGQWQIEMCTYWMTDIKRVCMVEKLCGGRLRITGCNHLKGQRDKSHTDTHKPHTNVDTQRGLLC